MARVTLISVLGAARRLAPRPPYQLRRTHERLLGFTPVELQIEAGTGAEAEQAEHDALKELARLSAVLRLSNPDSELSRWLARPGVPDVPLSLDLTAALRQADHWRRCSGGVFHPGAEALRALWVHAASVGQRPAPAEVRRLVSALQGDPWTLHADGRATLHLREPLALGALEQGFMVEQAAAVASRTPGVRRVVIRVGGRVCVRGRGALTQTVADPFTARDDARPLTQVRLRGMAMATGGVRQRAFVLNDQAYSGLMDPRTGCPVQQAPGVTVLAPHCAAADALVTILSVQDVKPGLALVNQLPGCAALIVTPDGQRHASQAWHMARQGRGAGLA